MLAGLTRGLDNDALHRSQDGIGTALVELNALGAEAERERARAPVAAGRIPARCCGPSLRLRHDLVMIGRASVVPLPADLQARLAGPLADVSDSLRRLSARACAAALRTGARAPAISPIDAVQDRYAAEVAAVRSEGLTRGLPGDVVERFFALGFVAGADAAESEGSRALRHGVVRDVG